MTMTSQFADITTLSIFFDVVLFLLLSLVTGPSLIPYKELTRNPEIPLSEFCAMSGD